MKSLTRSRTARRGFTLRELSIAIAIGSSVMMVAVGLVHQAFDWSTLARHRRLDDQTFFQLSRQLRNDLHIANQADLDSGDTAGQSLRLSVNENEVVYTLTDMTVTRTERSGDDVVRNEVYRFKHPRTLVLTRLETDNQIQLDVKTITPFAESETPLWRSLRMSIGLRLRHQNGDIAS